MLTWTCFMAYNLFDKKASGSGIKNEHMSEKDLAEELHKLIWGRKSTITFYR